jgi:(1->4)-alpha-D-glucan 1-alpha-D-glucosylmutase
MNTPSKGNTLPRIPSATYRLQFNRHFTFSQARDVVDYLHDLGISDCYSSPYFEAAPDSTHGYDISNHNNFNPSIGTRDDYQALVAELHRHEMGQVADFVPNHMGIASRNNKWWMDVLENGPASQFANYFDIDWDPIKEELENKVLLAVLGDQYGRVLERGELRLGYEGGAFFLHYYDFTLPVAPCTYGHILHPALEILKPFYNPELFDELQSILNSIDHLPRPTEKDPEKVQERSLEKEVIKRRLDRLCRECPQLLEGIEQAIHEINGQPGDPLSFDQLHHLLNAQMYRLSYWRVAAEEINFRRFFDINELAAIRVEVPEVFEAVHQLIFELLAEGSVTGLRIDHPDGLWNPREYFETVQRRFAEIKGLEFTGDNLALYLVGEKILTGNERIPEEWLIHGTTGYDFTNQLIGVLIDPAAEKPITDTYFEYIDARMRLEDVVYHQKRLVMHLALASDTKALASMLNRLSERNRWYRDFTLSALTTAVREVIACFPVYRTYLAPDQPLSIEDQQAIVRAVARAKRRNPAVESSVFNFLRDNLLFQFPENIDDATTEEHYRFVMKFQQCTGPVMAKGLEDTAFYVYNRMVALNEVGGEPQRFGISPGEFHEHNLWRQQKWPQTMLCTSSHDTKRSEDTRARIAAISELPEMWKAALADWRVANASHKTQLDTERAPDENEEYLLYQTLIGTWPLHRPSEEEYRAYVARIQDYMTKAIKEAKVNTSWIQPFEEWDNAVRDFTGKILDRGSNRPFLDTFEILAEKTAQIGAMNSLSQTLLKLTVPGVPDIYQGNEIWDFSLVDPDNRRPVDYEHRRHLISQIKDHPNPSEFLENWRDGRIKLYLTRAVLQFRRKFPELFREGNYLPLELTGTFKDCGVAFQRRHRDHVMVVFAPRLTGRVGFPPLGPDWGDTRLVLDESLPFQDILTGAKIDKPPEKIELSSILTQLPFVLLSNKT